MYLHNYLMHFSCLRVHIPRTGIETSPFLSWRGLFEMTTAVSETSSDLVKLFGNYLMHLEITLTLCPHFSFFHCSRTDLGVQQ
jgi:hypothetical protein